MDSEFRSNEVQLVYLVNLERREAGMPPLRWNRELSEAAQWFARDTVEVAFNCDSVDSLKRRPGTRLRAFGYTNMDAYREVVACGYTVPAAATLAWMNNTEQRGFLLDPTMREAGAGYFHSQELGRGFVVLDLSADPNYGPVIINNEAPSTANSAVSLYLHPQASPAVAMKIANDPGFAGAQWEAVTTERAWQLAPGNGWRTVYVLTRDALGRTTLVTDTIFVGAEAPREEISLDQASNIGAAYRITTLPAGMEAELRLSQGWVMEDTDPGFEVLFGSSAVIDDADAVGGRATVLYAGYREGLARGATNELPLDRLLTAFFRLKIGQPVEAAEVARISIVAGGMEHGPLVLYGNDFSAVGEFAEFHVDFAYPEPTVDARLEVRIQRTGTADLVMDGVRFFGQPVAPGLPIVWSGEEDIVRSQGLTGRYEAASDDGAYFDVAFTPLDHPETLLGAPRLAPSPAKVVFESNDNRVAPFSEAIAVCGEWCDEIEWQASTTATWLRMRQTAEGLLVWVDSTGLPRDVYYGVINVTPVTQSAAMGTTLAPTAVEIELQVDGAEPLTEEEIVSRTWLPVTVR